MKKYILAVSGGPDSMAMLDMYKKKVQAVCTVNYNKRKNSAHDNQLVIDYCNLHNIKYYVYNVDKKIYKKQKNVNFQALARQIRYDFFEKIAKIEQNYNLMVAHNLNDSLETAFMQKKRHSMGLFYGISKKSRYKNLYIYRPLLGLQKSCLERYCKQKGINYAIDESNFSDIYERNKVRKIINSWSSQQTLDFINEIRKYNKKNKKLLKKVEKNFQLWKETDFSIKFINELDENIKYYLVYEFLKFHNEKNNSKNKINLILDYINCKNSKGSIKLENNKKLYKKNKKLIIS